MHFLNRRLPDPSGRTVIVLGCGRGGTSAIAGALRVLGIPFPSGSHPLKHESSPVVYQREQIDRRTTEANLRAMDGWFGLWGWKSPRDLFSVHSWVSMVRNPMFVLIWRDQIQTARSIVRRERLEFEVALRHVAEVYAELGRFAFTAPFPLAIVGYDELCAAPAEVLPELAAWLGCPLPEDSLARAARFLRPGDGHYTTIDDSVTIFSEAELALDQAATQSALYGQAEIDLAIATQTLELDIRTAETTLANLRCRLGEAVDDSGSPAPAPSAVPSRETDPVNAYQSARDLFIDRSTVRTRLQRRMDALAARLENDGGRSAG